MKPIKSIVILAGLVLVTSLPLSGQSFLENEPQPPSSDMWNFVHYGEATPSLYTGTLSLSVPFYRYEDPDFAIPISFDYASNGCIPNVRAGILGPGWSLNAGGVITREIRGLPDNYRGAGGNDCGYYKIYCDGFPTQFNSYYNYSSHDSSKPLSGLVYAGTTSGSNHFYYDAVPDLFHFQFMGYSGTFHLGPSGKVFVYDTNFNPDEVRVEIGVNENGAVFSNDHFTHIVFTMADGNRYIFYSEIGHDGSNLDFGGGVPIGVSHSENNDQIVGWHLSRVEAPNGRVIDFHYSRQEESKVERPYSYYCKGSQVQSWSVGPYPDVNGPSESVNYARNAMLNEILIDGMSILFSYYDQLPENHYVTGGSNPIDYNAIRLAGIRVLQGQDEVRRCALEYIVSNTTSNVRFLQSVDIQGEGVYEMDYGQLSSYPAYGSYAIDHWGYYNGSGTKAGFLNTTTVDFQTQEETYNIGNVREPNSNAARSGLLTSIHYPVGGYSVFEYEPHSYSKEMCRRSSGNFMPEMCDVVWNQTCGGMRIKRISHHAVNGDTLRCKDYRYVIPGLSEKSSGILLHKPRYKVSYYEQDNYMGTPMNNLVETYSNNLVSYGGPHIEYTTVKEIERDGSSRRYYFTSSESYPDMAFGNDNFYFVGDTSSFVILNPSDLMPANRAIASVTSRHLSRGKMRKTETLNTNGVIVQTETSRYDADSLSVAGKCDTIPEWLISAVHKEKVYVAHDNLVSKNTTRHSSNGPSVTSSTTYTYNATGQTASESVTGSDGTVRRTEYLYVTDSCRTGTVDAAMLAANCIGTPWRERVYEGNTLVSETVRVFYQPDSQNHPTLFCLESSSMRDGRTNAVYTTTFQHDALGRTVQVTGPDGRSSVHLWGHGGLYPVARIDGATLSQVRTAIGDATLGTAPLSGGLDATTAGQLRSSLAAPAEVTVYTWEPLVGLTGVTGPDGRSTTYEYNFSGKLKGIRDDGGHLVEEYRYSPDNKLN